MKLRPTVLVALFCWQPFIVSADDLPDRVGFEPDVAFRRLPFTEEQRTLVDKVRELHVRQASILRALRLVKPQQGELELIPSQQATLEEIADRRFEAHIADEEACKLIPKGDQKAARELLARIGELEQKREAEDFARIRETLLPHQQRHLGKLILRHCSFEFFRIPFATDIIRLRPDQFARIHRAQLKFNQVFVNAMRNAMRGTNKDNRRAAELQFQKRITPHAMALMREFLNILELDQVRLYLIARGFLKESQSLRQTSTTLPVGLRSLLEERLNEAERADSS